MAILVTRPEKDGEELCRTLNNIGINSLHQPLISIEQGEDFSLLPNTIQEADFIIAVSQHAVHWAYKSLQTHQASFPNKTYLAIGHKTAQILSKYTQQTIKYPKISDSEHLLELPILKSVKNKRILILRGNGGRELIANKLQQRGAKVSYSEIYQRRPIQLDSMSYWQTWQDKAITEAIITSGEQLSHLVQQTPKRYLAWLCNIKLYVPSVRIKIQAEQYGFLNIINTGSASNTQLIDAILKNYSQDHGYDE